MDRGKLIAFGDSFVEGTYYTNGVLNSPTSRQRTNFVTHLAKLLDYDVVNLGRHANSNIGIFWDIKNYLEKNDTQDNEIYLVCWTGILRTSKWDNSTKRLENDKYYYDEVKHDYNRENFISYSFIESAYNLLTKYNKKFYFTSSFLDYKSTWVSELITNKIINCWIDYYLPNNTLYDLVALKYGKPNVNRSWHLNHRQYTEDTPFLNKECHHPNKKGHIIIAGFLFKRLKQNTTRISDSDIFNKYKSKIDFKAATQQDYSLQELDWLPSETKENFEKNLTNPKYSKQLSYYVNNPIKYRHNSLGFRGDEVDFSIPFDMYLGCSFTYGVGLHEKHIWPYLVAKEINYQNYINTGMPGTGIEIWFSNFKTLLNRGQVRKLFAFIPIHPRIEVPFEEFEHSLTAMPANINTQGLKYPDKKNIFRYYLVNQLSDMDYTIDKYLQTVYAIKYLCEVNNIEFYGYNLYTHYLIHPTKESIIARDIHHPGKSFHEYLSKIFIAKNNNKDHDFVLYRE